MAGQSLRKMHSAETILYLVLLFTVFVHDVTCLLECTLGSGPLQGVCVKCSAGSYGVGGAVPCYACEKGWYSPVRESKECTLCPYGSTSADAGSSSCTACFEVNLRKSGVKKSRY